MKCHLQVDNVIQEMARIVLLYRLSCLYHLLTYRPVEIQDYFFDPYCIDKVNKILLRAIKFEYKGVSHIFG